MNSDTGLTLRPSQIAALVQPVLAASTPSSLASQTACPSTAASAGGLYTPGQMAGLGCGLGLPLLFALLVTLYLLRQEKRRFNKPKLMYKLPDDCKDEFTFRPPLPPPVKEHPAYLSHTASRATSTVTSRRGSMRTLRSPGPPVHMEALPQSFIERYETMKKTALVQEEALANPRHELHGIPKEVVRHELGERMSQASS